MRYKAIESQVRFWLKDEGYAAESVPFEVVELAAIQRPGWVQIYRFQICARKRSGPRQRLFGVLRDDARIGAKYRVSESVEERDAWVDEWIRMLGPGHAQNADPLPRWLVACMLAGIAILVILSLVNRF